MNRTLTENLTKDFIARSGSGDKSALTEEYSEKLNESAQSGGYNPMDLDYNLMKEIHRANDSRLDEWFRAVEQGDSLHEGVSAFTNSSMADQIQVNYRIGAMSVAPIADTSLNDCVTDVNVGCERNVDTDLPYIGDIAVEAKKGQSTDFFQIRDVNTLEYTKPGKAKFGFSFYREDLCHPFHSQMLNLMRTANVAFNYRKEKMIARAMGNMFALDASGSPRSNLPYIFNGVPYDFYQPIGGTGLWGNYHEGSPYAAKVGTDPLVIDPASTFPCPSRCNLDFWCFIDRLIEDKTDIRSNCLPVQFDSSNVQILTASLKTQERMQVMLGSAAVTMAVTTDDGCAAEKTYQKPAQEGISGYKYSKWFREMLLNHYQVEYGCTLSQAKQLADCFWAAGNFAEAFRWQIEWPEQMFERGDGVGGTSNTTSEQMNNECVLQIKHMTKASLAAGNPCALHIFKPVPA